MQGKKYLPHSSILRQQKYRTKWIKVSSLRTSITHTLLVHTEIKHPTRTDQANACDRLHAAEQRRLLSDWSVGNHSDACALPPFPSRWLLARIE